MALKDAWNALIGKQQPSTELTTANQTAMTQSDLFLVVQIPKTALAQYKKIPLAGLGALYPCCCQLLGATTFL